MYRTKNEPLTLAYVLAKLAKHDAEAAPTSVNYSTADKQRAKQVLSRLTKALSNCEVSSIKVIPIECNEE